VKTGDAGPITPFKLSKLTFLSIALLSVGIFFLKKEGFLEYYGV